MQQASAVIKKIWEKTCVIMDTEEKLYAALLKSVKNYQLSLHAKKNLLSTESQYQTLVLIVVQLLLIEHLPTLGMELPSQLLGCFTKMLFIGPFVSFRVFFL